MSKRRPRLSDLKWCQCDHVEGAHDFAFIDAYPELARCHYKGCDCTSFRPKKLNRLKRWVSGKP